jgi:hypothetical protein
VEIKMMFDEADVGVIVTLKPESANVALVEVLCVVSVALTTCNTLPTPATPARLDAVVNTVPELSGKFSVRSELLFGLAMVNVPVPEALPDKAIFDIFFSP